ncbi:MAG TPA: glutamate synthase-related protein, partial [Bacillota bacterium]|nr:glutamate synthase-related protein [Bacillota bacterium]
ELLATVAGDMGVAADQLELKDGKVVKSPEMDRRIGTYKKYHEGFGEILVQMNVEDTRFGVAEYVLNKHGLDTIELKWGQGAKCIGGEIQVDSLEYARFLKDRGYVVDPDPYDPVVEAAFKEGGIRSFARHSRLGATELGSAEQVREQFLKAVAHLRQIGHKRITLKTGSYGMEALALALRCATDAKLDLLTIDGAGGGTGMSPWNMMEHWGVPSLPLHARAYEYAKLLAERGLAVPDLALAGGLAREDHVFKALALGAPFVKMVCMGRAPMVPAFVGSNIEGVLRPENRGAVHGHWDELPGTVSCYGEKPEQIFTAWETVTQKVGAAEMKQIPFGAVAMYAYADKLACGLQQFMAGARRARLSEIRREDLMSANRETARETGIPYLTDSENDKALAILKA